VKTALFAWELGANLGHASPMAEIARALAGDGMRIVVAGRELENLAIAFAGIDAVRLQAPIWPRHRHWGNEETQANFLDVLINVGFGDPAKLAAVADSWRALLRLVEPDVIVSDHSPGLLVAAHGSGIPVISIGTGFTMPPLDLDRFPPMRADRGPIASEGLVYQGVSANLAAAGIAPPGSLVDLFRTTDRFVFGFPELDPYRSFRSEPLYLPPEPLPAFVPPPVAPRLFVYLGAEMAGLEAMVQALVEVGIPSIVYLRGDVGPLRDFLAMRGHEVHKAPPKLADVLPRVSHIISAGGSFTCHAALAAGRPHLIIPLHSESAFNLKLVEMLDAGQKLGAEADAGKIAPSIDVFVQNHRLIQSARHWAEVVAMRQQPSGAEAVQGALRRHLAG